MQCDSTCWVSDATDEEFQAAIEARGLQDDYAGFRLLTPVQCTGEAVKTIDMPPCGEGSEGLQVHICAEHLRIIHLSAEREHARRLWAGMPDRWRVWLIKEAQRKKRLLLSAVVAQ